MANNIRLPPLPTIKEIIKIYKIRALKKLSQNFLLDPNLNRKLVRSAGRLKNGWVCEVGPGPGGITRAILEKDPEELAVIEKDSRFLPGLELLNEASRGRMKIYHGDVLRFDMEGIIPEAKSHAWTERTPNIHLIGNLPFSVSTPLIIRWLEKIASRSGPWKCGRVRMTLTFQKEVMERMTASIAHHQRSRLSIMTQYLCDVRHEFTIPGRAFVPKPDVDVSVVHFIPRIEPLIDVPFNYVEKVVRHTFHYRQKMVKHGVRTLFPPDRPEMTEYMFKMAKVDPETRPYLLSIDDMGRLAEVYRHLCDENPGLFEYYYRDEINAAEWRRNKVPLKV